MNRRSFIQMTLGASVGLGLWEIYKTAFNEAGHRTAASLIAFKNIGVDDSDLSKLLGIALSKGREYADIFLEFAIATEITFDGDRIRNIGLEMASGGASRASAGDSSSFCATEDLTYEGLARTARAVADTSTGNQARIPSNLSRLSLSDLYPAQSTACAVPIHAKQAVLLRLVEAIQKSDRRVREVFVNYRDSLRFISLATSEGTVAYDTQPAIQLGLSVGVYDPATQKVGSCYIKIGARQGFEYFEANSPEDIGRRAVQLALHKMEEVPAPSGEMPVVLGPGHSGVLLHETVGHRLEADFNLAGYSGYADKLGETVASELCTVSDDGKRPKLNGSINVDDEGTPSQNTTLIERGRLVGYLHSRASAAGMGVAPTGNGRRQNFLSPPLPRMTNTYLHGGEASPEEIIRSVSSGIYARDFNGGVVDPITGDFNFTPTEAYLIEGGRITAPISNVLLIGNGPEVLKRITMVGSDLKFTDSVWTCVKQGQEVPVSVGTPTVKISKMLVGSSQ